MIDLTLDRLKRPVIPGLVPNFGTTVEVTEKNKGGLSTTEVDANMALAYELQREVKVSTSDTTSIVEHDAKVALIGDEAITLTLQGASYGGCELKITNRGSQTATILYNEGASIEIPPRGYLRFIWTLQDWWVEQRRNPQEDGGNIQTYTYVVDSDQALIDWANNDRNSGQDYTSVLIKRGTWTSTIGVNLTNAGTKVVVGEADSKLIFNEVEKCLFYETLPIGSEYYMTGVNIEGTGVGQVIDKSYGIGYGFYNCNNLTDCTSTVTAIVTGTSFGSYAYGFYGCNNLVNCTGNGNGYGNGYGFYNCNNLANCTGTGTDLKKSSFCYGFYGCNNLTNCTGIVTGTNHGAGYGFYNCNNLTNCTGTGTGHSTEYDGGLGYGFYNCNNLVNCTGNGNGNGNGYGFYNCNKLTNCTGAGTGNVDGYGFYNCKAVSHCKAGSNCTKAVFNTCYASNAQTSTYACADTANGGFNNTTNPSA